MTLWLMRIRLNLRDRSAHRDLTDGIRLHHRVMSLFPDDLGEQARHTANVLFRAEDTRTGPQLLIQAGLQPNPQRIPHAYGECELRDLTPLLNTIDKGVIVRYRIAANASKRAGRTSPNAGKIIALNGAAAEHWWTEHATRSGLNLRTLTATSLNDVTGKHPLRDEAKPARPITHALTRFDGVAVVNDPDALRTALRSGIGRGKSHGCGLLSLAIMSNA